jgi:large subunit ribosomal protein L4
MKQIFPRDYSYSLPRKALQMATRMALAAKVQDDEIVLIDKLEFDAPKTRDMAGIIKTLGCGDCSVLVTTAGYDANVYKSGRNIDGVTVAPSKDLNAYSVLSAKRVLMTTAALDALKSAAALSASKGNGETEKTKK